MEAFKPFFQDRRLHPRTQLQVTLRGLRLDPEGELVDTFHMCDISRSGLGAFVDRPYYPGERVVLNLPVLEDGTRRGVYATVVRCRPDQAGFKVGMRFDGNSGTMWVGNPAAAMAVAA